MIKQIKNQTIGDNIFDGIVAILLLLAVLVCVYPFLYVVSVALSSGEAVNKGLVTLLPVDLNLDAMKTVLKYEQLWISYGNTIFYTIVGTILNVAFTCLAAYPLSKRTFCFRKPLNFLLAFTMYFSGGLIPIYIVVTSLGLYNKRLAMLVPVLVSAYNVMICRSAFESISDELFEEAELEGANDFLIMHKIAIPLIKPTLAVLTLYYAVARYNDFFNAMRAAGYTDVERGERGSSEEHLTVAQFKTEREQERLAALERQVEKKEKVLQKVEQKIVVQKGTAATFTQIDGMGRKTLLGKVEFSQQEAEDLKQLAKKGIAADTTIKDLQRDLKSARRDAQIWKRRYEELKEQAKDFLAAVRKAPKRVMAFISKVLHTEQAEPPRFQRQRESAVER